MHYCEISTKASFYSRQQNLPDPNPRWYCVLELQGNFLELGFTSLQLLLHRKVRVDNCIIKQFLLRNRPNWLCFFIQLNFPAMVLFGLSFCVISKFWGRTQFCLFHIASSHLLSCFFSAYSITVPLGLAHFFLLSQIHVFFYTFSERVMYSSNSSLAPKCPGRPALILDVNCC